MQIVIDIDDNLYARLFDNGDEYVADMRRACVAIRKGTALPKGHGRLIDADAFIKNEECCGYIEDMDIDTFNLVTPTIIEADKESENT